MVNKVFVMPTASGQHSPVVYCVIWCGMHSAFVGLQVIRRYDKAPVGFANNKSRAEKKSACKVQNLFKQSSFKRFCTFRHLFIPIVKLSVLLHLCFN